MPFDPSKPFEDIAVTPAGPATNFDASKPFEDVGATTTTTGPDWKTLFSGVDGMDSHLSLDQRAAFAGLDNDTNNSKETRAQAVNQSYIQSKIPSIAAGTLQQNWGAVKDAYAKNALGIDRSGITDTELFSAIGAHERVRQIHLTQEFQAASPFKKMEMLGKLQLAHVGEGPDAVAWSLKNAWEKGNQPFKALPSMGPMPDIPEMGMNNPALAGTVYNIIKPAIEGIESPIGLATLGSLPALKAGGAAAKAAYYGITTLFTGLMAKATIEGSIAKKDVFTDPSMTTLEKAQALAPEIGSGLMALIAPFHTIMELKSAPEQAAMVDALQGKTAAEAVKVLRGEASKTAAPELNAALNKAAEGLDTISEETLDARQKEAMAAEGGVADEVKAPVPPAPPLEPLPPAHEITELENGSFVITNAKGELIDYATDRTEAERIANERERKSMAPPEPASPFSEEVQGPPIPDRNAPVGIKNASMDAQRVGTGLDSPDHGATVKWEESRALAEAATKKDPLAGQNLIREIEQKSRAMTPEETALALNEVNRIRIERNAADDALNAAVASGDEGAVANARIRVAMAVDNFRRADEVLAKSGRMEGQALNARRMMMNEDYSLAALERRHMAANGGLPLDEKQNALVQKIAKEYAENEKKFNEHRAALEQKLSESEASNAVLRLINEVRGQKKTRATPNRIKEYISEQADAARGRIRERAKQGMLYSGLDPADVADHVIIGADLISKGISAVADWSAAMVKEFGGHLNDAYLKMVYQKAKESATALAAEAGENRDIKAERKGTVDMMKEKAREGATIASMSRYVHALAEQFVRAGITEREPLIDAVHAELQKVEPAITRREAMDAISGYGDFKPLNPEKAKAELRDLKGQMQQLSKLEDMKKGQAPAKTGVERRVPSGEERRLQKMVNEAKRKGGFNVTDPETQLKTALEAIKTRLKNEIEDLDHQIATGIKTVKGKTETPYDAEATLLREKRDALKAQFDEMFPKKELTNEQRVSIAEKAADRQIAELERQIKTGEVFPDDRVQIDLNDAQLAAKRQRVAALKEERGYLRETLQSSEKLSPEESSNRAFRTRTRNRIAFLEERIANNDYATRPTKPPLALDAASKTLMAEKEAIKKQDALAQLKYEEKNRTKTQKVLDAFVKWVRVGALSWPTVFEKLAGAAVWRTAFSPIEQVVGAGLSKLQPELAAKAPRRGVPEIAGAIKAEAKAHTEGIVLGIKGVGQLLQNKDTELSLFVSEARLPAEWYDYFGKLHAALKETTKMSEFSRSIELRTQHALRNGIDPRDPVEQMRLINGAYKDANAAVFMQDNALVDRYKRLIASLEEKQKATGKPHLGLQLIAAGLQGEMPIVKVPTNIVAEINEYMTGALTGTAKSIWAHYKGIENLSESEADLILRLQTKGLVGTSLLLLGFFKAQQVGGFYQHGEKRNKKDVQPGDLKIGDTTIDHAYLHSPQMGVVDFGASVRRTADSRFKKTDAQPKGLPAGLFAASLGLLDTVPFVRETSTLDKYMDERQAAQAFESKIASVVIPGLVQWTAAQMDKKSPFSPFEDATKRKPTNLKENFEKAIPGFRDKVPKKKD